MNIQLIKKRHFKKSIALKKSFSGLASTEEINFFKGMLNFFEKHIMVSLENDLIGKKTEEDIEFEIYTSAKSYKNAYKALKNPIEKAATLYFLGLVSNMSTLEVKKEYKLEKTHIRYKQYFTEQKKP